MARNLFGSDRKFHSDPIAVSEKVLLPLSFEVVFGLVPVFFEVQKMIFSGVYRMCVSKFMSVALIAIAFNASAMADGKTIQLAQNSSGVQATRVIIDRELQSIMRNVVKSRHAGQRVHLAKKLADQINGNRLRKLRSNNVERLLQQNLRNLVAKDMGQIKNLLSQLQGMQSQLKDLALMSGGSYGNTRMSSEYTNGGNQLVVHESPRNGDAGHHTFSIYEKDESGKFSQTQVNEFDLDENGNKSGRKKSDGDGSEPSEEALIFSNNNPDGSSKDEIIAETEARMLIPQLVSLNNNLSTVESYLFSYMVSAGLIR